MKKIFLSFVILLLSAVMLSSCADSKTFTDKKGKSFEAKPYGWANTDSRKIDTVMYEPSVGNIVLSCIFVETLFVPVWLTGWELWEPVRLRNAQGK